MRQRNQKFNFVVLALRSKPFVMLHATPIQLVSQNVLSCTKEIGKSSVCRNSCKKKAHERGGQKVRTTIVVFHMLLAICGSSIDSNTNPCTIQIITITVVENY